MNRVLLLFFFTTFFTTSFSQSLNEDFEANNTVNIWVEDDSQIDFSFSNPFKNGINISNKVLKYIDDGGTFANVNFSTKANFDLSTNNIFSVKIYISSSDISGNQNNQISLKLQNGLLGQPWSTQSEIIKNVVLDTWQTITFNFENDTFINLDTSSSIPTNRKDFNRVLIQINGENNQDKVIAYLDDFYYNGIIKVNEGYEETIFNKLVWADEFNGNGAVDANKWFHQEYPIQGGQNWANGEIQHYTNRTENSFESNGVLKILARKESYTYNNVEKNYTSARLNSKFAFTYGRVEIRAKMPFGVGTFPALWMLGQNITETGGFWAASHGTTPWPDCGEVDIIEHWGANQDYVSSAMHNRSSFGGTVNKGGRKVANVSTEFNIYSLSWDENQMIFKVNGIEHYRYKPENKNIQNWPYNSPQYLLFNVAILPNISAGFTQSAMEIDYVRVYQKDNSLATENIDKFSAIKHYPNPIESNLTIVLPDYLLGAKATIYSVLGKKIESFTQNNTNINKDFSNYKKGIYFIRLEKGKYAKKITLIKK